MSQRNEQNLVAAVWTGITGNGSPTTIKHGLGVAPLIVLVVGHTAAAVPFVTSFNSTDIVTQGASDTYDVIAISNRSQPF